MAVLSTTALVAGHHLVCSLLTLAMVDIRPQYVPWHHAVLGRWP